MPNSTGRDESVPFTYDIPSEESPSSAVVAAVAAVAGYRPVAAERTGEDDAVPVLDPLYTVVNPDALDAMFRDDGSPAIAGRVRFTYHDCDVAVRSDGVVTVTPPECVAE
ncbi:HalOD1 output domain-containing protein [Halopelagius fulvigenes]|uniref:HalOD1 output domain-containing protein n=1 Tax=Halopelagius fulvigenes TaxID=1198324 RepID=A0ABD5U2D6_9EURY